MSLTRMTAHFLNDFSWCLLVCFRICHDVRFRISQFDKLHLDEPISLHYSIYPTFLDIHLFPAEIERNRHHTFLRLFAFRIVYFYCQ
jgi:hypothetical protein